MKDLNRFLSAFFILAFVLGCASAEKWGPLHDEVLRYPIAYDLAYLRTTEALQNVDGWELEETEKEAGMIKVRNINYTRLDDSDKKTAVFYVKRITRRETSVELAPESQRIIGAGQLMERIGQYLSKEI